MGLRFVELAPTDVSSLVGDVIAKLGTLGVDAVPVLHFVDAMWSQLHIADKGTRHFHRTLLRTIVKSLVSTEQSRQST